jgi:glycosyltransferase involved in cell wall biosynthesis
MRIGIYSDGYPGLTSAGGIATYTRELAHGLCALGHEVHVLTSGLPEDPAHDGPVWLHTVRNDYFPVVERILPGSGPCYHIGAAMKRVAAKHELDVVEFPNWEGVGLWYAVRRPAPLVVRLHTSSFEAGQINGIGGNRAVRWDVRREKWLARSADTLVTHSEAHRRRMAEEIGIDAERIAVVPHGISFDRDFQRPARRGTELTVVYLGRLENRKGTIDVLRAVPGVLRDVPEARFVLIGVDRPHCPGGRTHAQYLEEEFPSEVRSRITLTGRLPDVDVDRWLQTADLFVAPSLYESFGLVFLEAMRWGTPVIGTRAGGIPEIVEDGESGILVPPSEPCQLAQAIAGLLRSEDRRRRLGEAGRHRVETIFSLDRMARQVADFYLQTIQIRSEKDHRPLSRARTTLPPKPATHCQSRFNGTTASTDRAGG